MKENVLVDHHEQWAKNRGRISRAIHALPLSKNIFFSDGDSKQAHPSFYRSCSESDPPIVPDPKFRDCNTYRWLDGSDRRNVITSFARWTNPNSPSHPQPRFDRAANPSQVVTTKSPPLFRNRQKWLRTLFNRSRPGWIISRQSIRPVKSGPI